MKFKYLFVVAFSAVSAVCTAQTKTIVEADIVRWGEGKTRTDTRLNGNAGLQGNEYDSHNQDHPIKSGFFETSSPVNFPTGASSWWHLLDVRHSNAGNNYAMQFSGSFFDQQFYVRKTENTSTTPWSRIVVEDPFGKASAGRLLSRSLAYVDNDKFNYNNGSNAYAINNYGLEWNSDSWNMSGATAWLSGFGGVKLFTGAQCRMAIAANGNVGIGTAAPSEKLAVDGTIACRRVKVSQSGWPDYVFDRNYPLRNLDAVESYINQHRHLPDVPAAAQVETEGLNLGENQAVLLRKVEELTLYVIKLNKAMQKLEKVAQKLETENKQQKRIIAKLAPKQ